MTEIEQVVVEQLVTRSDVRVDLDIGLPVGGIGQSQRDMVGHIAHIGELRVAHPDPDPVPYFVHGIRRDAHLRRNVLLARNVHARAARIEAHAVITAFDGVFADPALGERKSAMRTTTVQRDHATGAVPIEDQRTIQDPAFDRLVGDILVPTCDIPAAFRGEQILTERIHANPCFIGTSAHCAAKKSPAFSVLRYIVEVHPAREMRACATTGSRRSRMNRGRRIARPIIVTLTFRDIIHDTSQYRKACTMRAASASRRPVNSESIAKALTLRHSPAIILGPQSSANGIGPTRRSVRHGMDADRNAMRMHSRPRQNGISGDVLNLPASSAIPDVCISPASVAHISTDVYARKTRNTRCFPAKTRPSSTRESHCFGRPRLVPHPTHALDTPHTSTGDLT